MSLKQSIVIVNEFSQNLGGKGTRGSTPGGYVSRYMARDGATENLTPIKLMDADAYITRYMARESAVEQETSVAGVKKGIKNSQKYGGVAFGYGSISLSDEAFEKASRDIQKAFDSGKTILKTVISFDEDYLRENGLIPEGFTAKERGDYRGRIDQMKLRMGIMHGLSKMARKFDDLAYVGVIQVDTLHVHCHLAMVDKGHGRLASNGKQRGKLTGDDKMLLRHGIDLFLDQNQKVRHMSSNIMYDRRNAVCFLKKYTHKVMEEKGLSQMLLSVLPEDKRLWRASTNRKEMRRANAITREYVLEVLNQPDSGYKEAIRSVDAYARSRQRDEDLTNAQYMKLYKNGCNRILSDCMNSVYDVLKQVPREERALHTPMLDAMSMDYASMAAKAPEDPMVAFGFKLRSYASRMEYHKKKMRQYHEAVAAYQDAPNVSEDSRPFFVFMEQEEIYQAKLLSKYQHFLSFLPPDTVYEEQFLDLMRYGQKVLDMKHMLEDASMKRMKPEAAEEYGKKVYNLTGGQYLKGAKHILDFRFDKMQKHYARMEADFQFLLAEQGLSFSDGKVKKECRYPFDEVKALDLHHMAYDFYHDVPISKRNVDRFLHVAEERYQRYLGAKEYLERTDQLLAGEDLLQERDILLMVSMARQLSGSDVFPSRQPQAVLEKSRGTLPLDHRYEDPMKLAIRSAVQDAAGKLSGEEAGAEIPLLTDLLEEQPQA